MKKIIIVFTAALIFLSFFLGSLFASNAKAEKSYKYAMQYQTKKNFKYALKYYNDAIKKDKKFWQAWLGLGICYYNLKKMKNAQLVFKKVISMQPNNKTAKKYLKKIKPDYNDEAKKERLRKKTKGEMVWRSMLLPGWGQFHNNERVKGYFYALGFLAGIGGTIKFIADQNTAVDAYENANYDFDAKYIEAQDAATRVFIPIGVTALIWGMSVIDAFLTGEDSVQGINNVMNIKIKKGSDVAFDIIRVQF